MRSDFSLTYKKKKPKPRKVVIIAIVQMTSMSPLFLVYVLKKAAKPSERPHCGKERRILIGPW